jgi:hypothetical protein
MSFKGGGVRPPTPLTSFYRRGWRPPTALASLYRPVGASPRKNTEVASRQN